MAVANVAAIIALCHLPYQGFAGQWHGISLASHGDAGAGYHLIVLVDSHVEAPVDWIALPPLLDARTTLAQSAVPHEVFVDIGLTGEETTLEAVVKLGDLHPLMGL